MIRKTLILGLIIIVIVVLGLPLAFSFRLDKYESAYVDQLSNKSWLRVQNTRFSRGWFSSQSHITLVPDGLVCSDDCPRIHIDSTVYHGPLPFEAFSRDNISPQFDLGIVDSRVTVDRMDAQTQINPPLPPLQIVTVIPFIGNERATLNMPASQHRVATARDNYQLSVGALQGSARLTNDSRLVQADVQGGGFTLKEATDQAVVAQASGLGLLMKRSQGGELHLIQKLHRLRVHGLGGAAFELQDLQLDSRSHSQNGLASGHLNLSFDHLSAGARTYGPAMARIQANRIDLPALQRLNAGMAKLASNHLSPALALVGALAVYQNNVAALLRPGPELNIQHAALGTPEGRLSGNLDIKVPPSKRAGAPGLTRFIDSLQVQGRAQIPKPIMRSLMRRRLALEQKQPPSPDRIDQALQHLVSRGVLKPAVSANAYDMQVALSQGQLTINGQTSKAWQKLHTLLEQSAGRNPLLQLERPGQRPPQTKQPQKGQPPQQGPSQAQQQKSQ